MRADFERAAYRHCACGGCFETVVGTPGTICDDCIACDCEGPHSTECKRVPDFELDHPVCPLCGGENVRLGELGNHTHYRCRRCGADSRSTP